jgi:hypothetical protein
MKKFLFRTSFIFLLCTIIFSCANSKSHDKRKKSTYRLIKTEKLINHKLFSFATNNDTILVVSKNNISPDCIEENLGKISLQNNNKIYMLNDNGEEIIFFYYTEGNNYVKIRTSSEKPGSPKKQINSYNSLPYFVENCN